MSDRVLVTHADPEALARAVSEELGEPLPWCRLDGPGSADATVWLCAGAAPEPPLELPRLRWIQSGWAGVEVWFSRPEWGAKVLLTRTVGDFPQRVAQHVFGYLLARTLDVNEALRQMEARAWKRWTPGSIAGRNLLVVGLGAIGSEVAAVGRAFGMAVKGIRRGPVSASERDAGVHETRDVDTVLPWADVVANLLPLTLKTESFFDGNRFTRMRPGSTFISVSRGATVDETALLRGLAKGSPGSAILDVFREEPLPPSHPLRGVESLWVTPHVAGVSTIGVMAREFAENWRRFRTGAPPLRLVDRGRGY